MRRFFFNQLLDPGEAAQGIDQVTDFVQVKAIARYAQRCQRVPWERSMLARKSKICTFAMSNLQMRVIAFD